MRILYFCRGFYLLLKFRWICSSGYGVMGLLSWVWLPPPQFSAPLVAKLCVKPPKVFEVQERARGPLLPWPCQVWWGSYFTGRRGVAKNLRVFLSVCLFVTLLNVRACARNFAVPWRRWRLGVGLQQTILIPLDRGRFVHVVVHPCSTFSDCCQLATPLNDEVQKNRKNCFFLPSEGDRTNRSRRNLINKRTRWVCSSALNLALIGKRGR